MQASNMIIAEQMLQAKSPRYIKKYFKYVSKFLYDSLN